MYQFKAVFKGKQGWSEAGANVLAGSCFLTQSLLIYFRPKIDFRGFEGFLLVALTSLGNNNFD